jgi:galactonate dehydratase
VRDAVGENVDICLDYHSTDTSAANAIKMAKTLEPLNPTFLEEPVLHENVDAMAEVKANTVIPIATGERLFTRYGFREVLEKRAVDIIQPDPIVCGGILETLRIANMAETYYISLAPHNPFGPVATAVCVQIAACATNFFILEYVSDDKPPRSEVVPRPVQLNNGYLEIPTKPGIGVDLDEHAMAKYPYATWDRRTVILEDGSVGLA